MNQGWWSNIFQLSRLISRVNQTPFQAIFWIILILFFPTNSYRSSNKNEIQRDIFEMYRACESCRIFVSYLFDAHNGISYCMEKDRRKIAGKWRGFFFFFFLSLKKKVHRSWGKIVQWKSKRIRDVSHCLEFAFVIRSEEKSALRRRLDRKWTNANRFEQKSVRKYGRIVTRISEISPCCCCCFSLLFFSSRKFS